MSNDFIELENFLRRFVNQLIVHIATVVIEAVSVLTWLARPLNIPHRHSGVIR